MFGELVTGHAKLTMEQRYLLQKASSVYALLKPDR